MAGAEATPPRQRFKRYGLGKMLLDISDCLASLPCRETAAGLRLRAARSRVDSRQLMSQHDPQGVEVLSMIRVAALDQCRQLQRRLHDCAVLEEYPRRQ